MKEKETSKANITRRRQEIREELSAPPRRSVDEIHLSRGRQTIDLDDDEEGKLDDVPLLPKFETPPAPKRRKKVVGARARSKQHGISIADLETIEEDNDDETPEPSDNLNWLIKKKKMQEEYERQEKLQMELETMEQASDTSSYASTEGYYQGQRSYLAYPHYPNASYYIGGGAYAQSTESDSHSHDPYESYGSYQGADPAPIS
ncbi:hypothetical protein Taro_015315 [Colocasia esculenta]|uniref:Uncharacterized protein n=1 Tax=Colocasia esculenta TaxID=4460 RepID=A0A843UH16_COLES|nr:hypothetical protein [Colocasia esculenta]